MNINITFRHMDTSGAAKAYAGEKVAKLQKYLREPMTAKVTLESTKLRQVAEARISAGGQHYEAKVASEDMYASIDKVIAKLERQMRGSKGAAESKKRRAKETLRGKPEAPEAVPEPLKRTAKKKAAKKKVAKKAAKKKASKKKAG